VSVAVPAGRPSRARRAASGAAAPRARSRTVRARRRALSPAVLWIVLLAALFGGIVALNVGALRATIETSQLEARTQALHVRNADLAASVARGSSYFRIAIRAQQLGMVPAYPNAHDFIPFTPSAAAHHHHAPPPAKAPARTSVPATRGAHP
jgi:hypothetical protein